MSLRMRLKKPAKRKIFSLVHSVIFFHSTVAHIFLSFHNIESIYARLQDWKWSKSHNNDYVETYRYNKKKGVSECSMAASSLWYTISSHLMPHWVKRISFRVQWAFLLSLFSLHSFSHICKAENFRDNYFRCSIFSHSIVCGKIIFMFAYESIVCTEKVELLQVCRIWVCWWCSSCVEMV